MLSKFLLFCLLGWVVSARAALHDELWRDEVEPVLDRYCFKCHAGVRQKGGLDLRSLETMLRGGENGPALLPGVAARSHIVEFVQAGAETHMPPEEKKQLSPKEIDILKRWVESLPKVDRGSSVTNSAGIAKYLGKVKETRKISWVPSQKLPARDVIDGFLARGWKEKHVKASAMADDRTFVRRVYLDLAGRIPTEGEVQTFLKDRKPNAREGLVDSLLASDEYGRSMRERFDVILMGRPVRRNEAQRRDNGWHAYLERSFQQNRPWNQMVREMVVARGTNSESKGAFWFLYEKQNNHQAMAEALGPVAFGVNMKCAQCHNHPLAWEIEQRHYWGLVAAFNRSKTVQTSSGPAMSESAIGGFVNFANLKKESQPAMMAFLNGKIVEEKRPDADAKEEDKPELYVIPPKEKNVAAVPKFSRREALAEAITQDNPLLARAFVNRMWALLMGRGIVNPVDQIDSRHRPSHPDLLDWLSQDFEKTGYDVKRLVKNIVTSKGYQLDSKPAGGKRPRPETFACAIDKPLTAEQLMRSVLVATKGVVPKDEPADFRKLVITNFPEVAPAQYNPSLQQALFISNSPLLNDLLKEETGNTAARLNAITSTEERISSAFEIVLGRAPEAAEKMELKKFLGKKPLKSGTRDLLWALLSNAEFQMNH